MPPERSQPAVLAVDGGGSKTEAALVGIDGTLLGAVRLQRSSNLGLGCDTEGGGLPVAVRAACAAAGVAAGARPIATTAVYCLAGVDLPVDERRIRRLLRQQGWSDTVLLRNDTFAMLRAGTDDGWGVAVGCGSGINCAGVGPDGKTVRFPAVGYMSGDLAGGAGWLGSSALGWAVRGRDGRGPHTALERMVPEHFRLRSPLAVVEAVYVGRLPPRRLDELAPVVFEAAAIEDAVARKILDDLADEIVTMVRATLRRLHATAGPVAVVLGGGVFKATDAPFLDRVRDGILAVNPSAGLIRLQAPPVLGAALMGLDRLGAAPAAAARLRGALTAARLAVSAESARNGPAPAGGAGRPAAPARMASLDGVRMSDQDQTWRAAPSKHSVPDQGGRTQP